MQDKKPLVFVVDDEAIIAVTLAAILRNEGFEAEPFTSPLAALKAAESNTPDYLISDVVMPVLNGVDLCVQFKAIYPECRILLFSGQAATGELLGEAKKKGHHFDLLAKPVHPQQLLQAVSNLK